MSKRSSKDKTEGPINKAVGRANEAGGSLTGKKEKKAEGRTDHNKGTLKKQKHALKDHLT